MIFVVAATILACIFIGWTIGANDAANCVGAAIGSGRISYRFGIFVTSLFGFLGSMLIGQHVIKTIGKGIVPMQTLDPKIALYIALASCFGAGLFVVVATYRKLPVSTSHSIVGAVGGAGLAFNTPIFWDKLGSIFIGWLATPVGAALIAAVAYYPVRLMFYRLVPSRFRDQATTVLITVGTAYSAFSWGGNDVANASGVISGAGLATPLVATLIGAVAIVIGIVTWGHKVIETVGFKISRFIPMMTIVAQYSSAFNVYLYTMWGIPVSTSHSIVGAVVGVGWVTRKHVFDFSLASEMLFAWAVTPFAAGLFSYITIIGIKMFVGL